MPEQFIAELIESNRVTVPAEIVEVLKVKKGDKLRFTVEKVKP